METGRIVLSGNAAELLENDEVKKHTWVVEPIKNGISIEVPFFVGKSVIDNELRG